MTNTIDRRAVVLAEQVVLGLPNAEGDLKKLIHTIQLSDDAHDRIRETLGTDTYRRVA
jgi:hypothetical protein